MMERGRKGREREREGGGGGGGGRSISPQLTGATWPSLFDLPMPR